MYRSDPVQESGLRTWCRYILWMDDFNQDLFHIVELGCSCGDSIRIYTQEFPKYEIFGVDPFADGEDSPHGEAGLQAFLEKHGKDPHIKLIRKTSEEAVSLFRPNTINVLYIDAVHTYEAVKADIKNWWPIIKEKGWIGGHDYSDDFPGVKQAVGECFFGKATVLLFEDSSWLVRKNDNVKIN